MHIRHIGFAVLSAVVALGIVLSAESAHASVACRNVEQWPPATVYTGSETVRQDDLAYRAKWWTQNPPPATNSGGTADWATAWLVLGPCSGDATPPTEPVDPPTTGRIDPDYPGIAYMGRWNFSDPKNPSFSEGHSIKARFEGTSIEISMDQSGPIHYQYQIDDRPLG